MLSLVDIVSNNKIKKDTKGANTLKSNDWSFRMLIIGPSGSDKTNTLLHLINNLHSIDKIYLYAKDIGEDKYNYLIKENKQE